MPRAPACGSGAFGSGPRAFSGSGAAPCVCSPGAWTGAAWGASAFGSGSARSVFVARCGRSALRRRSRARQCPRSWPLPRAGAVDGRLAARTGPSDRPALPATATTAAAGGGAAGPPGAGAGRSARRGSGSGAASTAAMPPPARVSTTAVLATSDPVAAPPAPNTVTCNPSDGATGRIRASARRCARTWSRNSRQPGHSRRWRRSVVRRSAPPRRFASCSRTSAHGVSRAARLAISELRAWNTSAFTFSRGQPSTWPISSCDTSPSSASTSAARWSCGSPARSPSSARRSCRRSTWCERCSVDGSAGRIRHPLAPRAQQAEAAVARDRVQPRPPVDLLRGAGDVVEGGQERLLDGVLGLLGGAEHVAAEGQHAAMVARVKDLEGRLGAAPQQVDQSLVRRQPEQARAKPPPSPPCEQCLAMGGHAHTMVGTRSAGGRHPSLPSRPTADGAAPPVGRPFREERRRGRKVGN